MLRPFPVIPLIAGISWIVAAEAEVTSAATPRKMVQSVFFISFWSENRYLQLRISNPESSSNSKNKESVLNSVGIIESRFLMI